jgi:hypothetical protein
MPKPGSNDSDNNVPMYEALRRQARNWLTTAGKPTEPSLDPVFQLMLWGLDQGVIRQDSEYRGALRSELEALAFLVEPPDHALKYLMEIQDHQGEYYITPDELQQAESPKHASQLLLQALDWKLTAVRGDWPPIYPKGSWD